MKSNNKKTFTLNKGQRIHKFISTHKNGFTRQSCVNDCKKYDVSEGYVDFLLSKFVDKKKLKRIDRGKYQIRDNRYFAFSYFKV